jgi:hypothetical protein
MWAHLSNRSDDTREWHKEFCGSSHAWGVFLICSLAAEFKYGSLVNRLAGGRPVALALRDTPWRWRQVHAVSGAISSTSRTIEWRSFGS